MHVEWTNIHFFSYFPCCNAYLTCLCSQTQHGCFKGNSHISDSYFFQCKGLTYLILQRRPKTKNTQQLAYIQCSYSSCSGDLSWNLSWLVIVSKQTAHMGLPLNSMNRYSASHPDRKVRFWLIECSVKIYNIYIYFLLLFLILNYLQASLSEDAGHQLPIPDLYGMNDWL